MHPACLSLASHPTCQYHHQACSCPASLALQPHVRGFDDQWFFFDGQPGETVSLLSTGDGAKLDATLGAGGLRGQATFVRTIAFQQGAANVVAAVYEQDGQWRMAGAHPGSCKGFEGQVLAALRDAAPALQ